MTKARQQYREMLRTPQWQRRRLEIFERDGFRCTVCGADDAELHVHHRYYIFGRPPWEYEDESLLSMCGECHRAETERTNELKPDLERALGIALDADGKEVLIALLDEISDLYPREDRADVLACLIEAAREVKL